MLIFLLKVTSGACFLDSGSNLISHWKAQSLIFIKSLFRSFAAKFMFWITENRDREVLYANNFGFEVEIPDKSLILIRKKDGPRIDPWKIPASTLVHDKFCPFKTTYFFDTKIDDNIQKVTWYTILLQLVEETLVPNFINVFEISRKMPLVSKPSWVIDKYRKWYVIDDWCRDWLDLTWLTVRD